MGRIRWQVSAVVLVAILACVPIGTGARSIEIATLPAAKATVTNVRVGLHTDKTRIVLDISQPIAFRYHVSSNGTAVFIDLPDVKWTASPFEPRHSKGKILEFHYSPAANGGRFNILTDGPVSISEPFFVKPKGKRGHRIVIDLVGQRLTMPHFGRILNPSH